MKRFIQHLAVVLAIVLADQLAKLWAVEQLKPVREMPFIKGIIHFWYVENIGAAFSMFPAARWFFVAITPLVIAAIVYILLKGIVTHPLGVCGLVFLTGGAIGNFIDRLRSGFVVDFLEFQFINFAIFNVADIFISIGGVMICVYFIFLHEKQKLEA